MPNYKQSKIYKIMSTQTDEIYIGSTCQKYLSDRMATHRQSYKNPDTKSQCESKHILKYGDAKIRLIEKYPCSCKEELLKREQFFIDTMDCVNKKASFCSYEDMIKQHQEWNKNNPEKIKAHYETKKAKKFTCPMCNCTSSYTHRVRHIESCFTNLLDGLNQILLEEKKELSPAESRAKRLLTKKLYNAWNRSMEGLNKICID